MSGGSLVRLGVLGTIWGASFLLIKIAVQALTPVQVTFGRLLTGTAVLLVILAVRRLPLPRGRRLWGHLLAMGLLANVVPFTLFAYAEQRISSGLAGVLNGTTPLFTLLVAVAAARVGWSDERLTRTRVVGLGIGFLGTVVVVAPWREGAFGGTLEGQLACLLAAACYGFAFVYTRRFISPSGHPPIALAAGQLSCAAIVLTLIAPFAATGSLAGVDGGVLLAVAVLGTLMTGLAYLLYYRLIEDAGATSASMVTYIVPVVAVLLGALVLREPLTWNLPVGAAVVIVGVAVAEGRIGPRRTRPVPTPCGSGEVPADGEPQRRVRA